MSNLQFGSNSILNGCIRRNNSDNISQSHDPFVLLHVPNILSAKNVQLISFFES